MEIIIHPVVVRFDKDGRPEKVVTRQTDNEWKKLIDEMKNSFKVYSDVYGIKVTKTSKMNGDFISVIFTIVNQNKYLEFGGMDDVDETFVSFVNWDLSHGDYPSFYKDNMKGNTKLDKFICI